MRLKSDKFLGFLSMIISISISNNAYCFDNSYSREEIENIFKHFIWKSDQNDHEVAASYSGNSIIYQSVSPPEIRNITPEISEFRYLSKISGIEIHTRTEQENNLNIYYIKNPYIFDDLKNSAKQGVFREQLHMPQDQYETIKKQLANGTICESVSFRDPNQYTKLTYILTNSPLDTCNISSIYYALGIINIDSSSEKDFSLCVLYESVKRKLRTKSEISSDFNKISSECRSRLEKILN